MTFIIQYGHERVRAERQWGFAGAGGEIAFLPTWPIFALPLPLSSTSADYSRFLFLILPSLSPRLTLANLLNFSNIRFSLSCDKALMTNCRVYQSVLIWSIVFNIYVYASQKKGNYSRPLLDWFLSFFGGSQYGMMTSR